jgi:hypothetical protein
MYCLFSVVVVDFRFILILLTDFRVVFCAADIQGNYKRRTTVVEAKGTE